MKIWSGKSWNNDWVCETASSIHCNFAGFTTIWDGSVANTSPLEYQKSLQCWKTMTILSYAIYPFYVESIKFLIKVIDVKNPLYHIIGLLNIIYDSHNVKWQPYCKHLNILIAYDIKFTFLNSVHIIYSPNHFLTVCCHVEAKNSSSVKPMAAILGNRGHIENN